MTTEVDVEMRALNERVTALDRLMDEKFRARDAAVVEVARETERIAKQQNEWRGTVNDLASTKIDRQTEDVRHDAVDRRLGKIEQELAEYRGRGVAVSALFGYAIGASGIIAAIVSLLR